MKAERLSRAYARQVAAIAAKRAIPRVEPRADGPIRLGRHVRLRRRVLIGPKPIDVIRANRRAAQKVKGNGPRGRMA